MYRLNHSGDNLISSRESFPSERNLLLQAGNGPGDSGLVLSTDAKPRLKWTPELHERFVETVNQLGGESVLEKAHATLEKQILGSAGHEAAKMQLSELVTKVPNESFTSGFLVLREIHGVDNLQAHSAQIADCSVDSCLTSCEGSQKDQEMHNINMKLQGYHSNLSSDLKEKQEDVRFEQINSGWWCGELNGQGTFSQLRVNASENCSLPFSRGSSILSMNITSQKEAMEGINISESNCRQIDKYNSDLERPSYRRDAVQKESSKNFIEFGMPCATAQLDLNVHDENSAAQNCKEFDLNGFSWN